MRRTFLGTFLIVAGKRCACAMLFVAALASLSPIAQAPIAQAEESNFGILSPTDRALYREIFLIQKDGQWEEAQKRINLLSNPILLGHVTEQRLMHPTDYRSPYAELRDWLGLYPDHPDATRIYRLARRRQPNNVKGAQKPHKVEKTSFSLEEDDTEKESETPRIVYGPEVIRGHDRAARQILAKAHRNVRREYLTVTEKTLRGGARKQLSKAELGEGLARVAQGWLRWGNLERALALAEEGIDLSDSYYPLAYWTAGMSAWQLGNFKVAQKHFISLSQSALTSREFRARGAWWASRVALRDKQFEDYATLLQVAAKENATFYGTLARHALGLDVPESPAPNTEQLPIEVLRKDARLIRAMALLEVGEILRAEEELLQLGEIQDPEVAAAILLLAERAQLAQLSVRAAGELLESKAFSESTSNDLLSSLYPFPAWIPEDGFRIDRALLYAIIREESRFNPEATSRSGARGVMQLMPATAAFITGERELRSQSGRRALHDPDLNINIGQTYLLHLIANKEIDTSLIHILAGYNAGPGNLSRWNKHLASRGIRAEDDVFLYLETLPALETRRYCLKVLRSLWHYRDRLGQSKPTLRALVSREPPRYHSLDKNTAPPATLSFLNTSPSP